MSRPRLTVVHNLALVSHSISIDEKLLDHQAILDGYLDTRIARNHSPKSIEVERRFLEGWFKNYPIEDDQHPSGYRQMFIWEAMQPVVGRERILAFSKGKRGNAT